MAMQTLWEQQEAEPDCCTAVCGRAQHAALQLLPRRNMPRLFNENQRLWSSVAQHMKWQVPLSDSDAAAKFASK